MTIQITEAQLFELLGRVYAEVRALAQENTNLKAFIAEQDKPKKAAKLKV